jgi:hypothetical protein
MYKVTIFFEKPWGMVEMAWITDGNHEYMAIEKILDYYDFDGEIAGAKIEKLVNPLLIQIKETWNGKVATSSKLQA